MDKKTMILVPAIIVVVVIAAAVALILLGGSGDGGTPIEIPSGAMTFDDFDDMSLGGLPGTSAGMMGGYPPDSGPEYFGFEPVGEGYALKLVVDVPANSWSGYWSFAVPGDISQDPIILVKIGGGRDVSSYSKLCLAARATTDMRIKIELQDTLQHSDSTKAKRVFTESPENLAVQKYGMTPAELSQELFGVAPENISTLSNSEVHTDTQSHNGSVYRMVHTNWELIEIPLSEFNPATQTSAFGLNLEDIRQINIVFEGEIQGTVYIDWIAFCT